MPEKKHLSNSRIITVNCVDFGKEKLLMHLFEKAKKKKRISALLNVTSQTALCLTQNAITLCDCWMCKQSFNWIQQQLTDSFNLSSSFYSCTFNMKN